MQVAFLDCDNKNAPDTFSNIQGWLAGLGYHSGGYPVVQTASEVGRHIWVCFDGHLPGSYRSLARSIGRGEFRFGAGSYVVAPPSAVAGKSYRLLEGDYRQLPVLTLGDVLPILQIQDSTFLDGGLVLPNIPRFAAEMLAGRAATSYSSRSEAEFAIIVSLVNAGHDFASILALFSSWPAAGKFAELRRQSERRPINWLRRSYDQARAWAETHTSDGRQLATTVMNWAASCPWPGRTGATDRAIYMAHATIAGRAGKLVYSASVRELAELAAVQSKTAAVATRRLICQGLLTRERPGAADRSALYRLNTDKLTTLPHNMTLREWGNFVPEEAVGHDAFRYLALGKSAAECFARLQAGPQSVEELALHTGRCVRTVRRALQRMACVVNPVTGETQHLVLEKGSKWYALEVDLDQVAELIGTAGTGQKQHQRHQRERIQHHNSLEAYRQRRR